MNGNFFRVLLWSCLLGTLVIPPLSAWTVPQITVQPSGYPAAGTPVNVSCTIQFAGSGGNTFPGEGTLNLYTDLDNPAWDAVLVLNGIDNPLPLAARKNVYLSGWLLSYKSSDVEQDLRVTLTGTVPRNPDAGQKLILIQELDSRDNVVPGSTVSRPMPAPPTPTPTQDAGTITFASVPAGADVFIDNHYEGITPLIHGGIPNGDHRILFRLTGYRDYGTTVSVLSDSQTIEAILAPVTAASAATSARPAPSAPAPTATPTQSSPAIGVAMTGLAVFVFMKKRS